MSRTRIILRTPADRDRAQRAVGEASLDTVVTIRAADMKDVQRNLFHAMLDEVAKHCVHEGRKLTSDTWKDVFVGGMWGWTWITCPLTGRRYCVRRSTERLTVDEYWDLIRFTEAEAQTVLGHTWRAFRPGDPEWEAARPKRREDAA